MRLLILAALGGALGAGARYLVNLAAALWLPPGFPWATFIVNVAGSFLMGLVIAGLLPAFGHAPHLRTFLATGVLGGFTTFSAFSLDAWTLIERQQFALLGAYVIGSVTLAVVALVAGLEVARVALR